MLVALTYWLLGWKNHVKGEIKIVLYWLTCPYAFFFIAPLPRIDGKEFFRQARLLPTSWTLICLGVDKAMWIF